MRHVPSLKMSSLPPSPSQKELLLADYVRPRCRASSTLLIRDHSINQYTPGCCCTVQMFMTSTTWSWEEAMAAVAAFYNQPTFITLPPSWRHSTTRPQPVLVSPYRRCPVRAARVPTAPSVMTGRPGSTTERRRAMAARVSFVARCARVTCTRAASNDAVLSTRTNATSADTVDFASASGQACAKKVSKRAAS